MRLRLSFLTHDFRVFRMLGASRIEAAAAALRNRLARSPARNIARERARRIKQQLRDRDCASVPDVDGAASDSARIPPGVLAFRARGDRRRD